MSVYNLKVYQSPCYFNFYWQISFKIQPNIWTFKSLQILHCGFSCHRSINIIKTVFRSGVQVYGPRILWWVQIYTDVWTQKTFGYVYFSLRNTKLPENSHFLIKSHWKTLFLKLLVENGNKLAGCLHVHQQMNTALELQKITWRKEKNAALRAETCCRVSHGNFTSHAFVHSFLFSRSFCPPVLNVMSVLWLWTLRCSTN